MPKPKTTSNNFQMKMNKNIVKDTNTEKDRSSKLTTPPSSKNSFRIRNQHQSKKLIEELLKINEEEKLMQA